ncbi:G_PROTEIN_RECEP_F1_2 domain-containing protein [Caenorhabditis elegans]|uniref:G_PROTEIN_RECEP_F1_2 domain-containing protein n=1 Tax=Caenorhabditis elegans TaxID=6239 RepID=Q7YWP3_CAEEL|nr:G_PROTEIN_RECEP_F1_2 domain-containing protein [Caenorhabditis elegans]CAE18014.2 G_PROTEIN_RECEP_F1_2 domain-containing protein [Caenorhabditis elegans]|eukprot:NP_001023547.1 Serpentine Receptor, class AB (class A-like) [Caenorhabditis elegans]
MVINQQTCDLMKDIATFPPLSALLLSFLILSILILPLMGWLITRIAKNQLYHLNTRILLIIHCSGIFIHCADRLFLHTSDLYNWHVAMYETSSCDIISTSERCFGLRLFLNIGLFIAIYTMPTLVLERYLALRQVATYQKNRTAWTWLVMFQLCLSTWFLGLIYSQTTFGGTTVYCIAAREAIPFNMLLAFSMSIVVQTVSYIGFRYLVHKNKNLKVSLQNRGSALTKRYQVEESLRSLETIAFPIQMMYFFEVFHSLSSFLFLNFNAHLSKPWYYFWMEISACLPEYAIAFLIAFVLQEKRLERKGITSLRKEMQVNPENYFDQYRKSWTTGQHS